MTYLAEDPKQIAAAAKDEAERAQDLNFILETPRGRRWVYRLIDELAHVNQQSHVPRDPDSTAFNEGARAVGLTVQLEAQRSPNYIKMLQENFPND